MSAPPPVIAVVGPTATGKTALAVALAQRLGGEVVNADSMQLYRGMDIGTAKPDLAERAGVPHRLLDLWHVRQAASAQPVDLGSRPVPVLRDGGGLPDVPQIEQVVRHPAPLGEVGLGGADVHAVVELHGIGVDHLPAQALREGDSQRRLARGGRADDGDDGRRRAHAAVQSATR